MLKNRSRKSVYAALGLMGPSVVIFCLYSLILAHTGIKKSGGQEELNTLGEGIFGSHVIGQTFDCVDPGLTGISIKLATYARANNSLYYFTLRQDGPTGTLLHEKAFRAKAVRDNQFHLFTFPTRGIDPSRTYYFELSSSQATPNNCITIWYHNQDKYSAGFRFVSGQKKSGDLAFRYYQKQSLTDLGKRLTENRPGLLGWSWMYGLIFFLFIIWGHLIVVYLWFRLAE